MNSNIYISNCYVYDKKVETIRESVSPLIYRTFHLVKVTDGKYFVKKWFIISYKYYYNETIKVKLYVSNEVDVYNVIAYT